MYCVQECACVGRLFPLAFWYPINEATTHCTTWEYANPRTRSDSTYAETGLRFTDSTIAQSGLCLQHTLQSSLYQTAQMQRRICICRVKQHICKEGYVFVVHAKTTDQHEQTNVLMHNL